MALRARPVLLFHHQRPDDPASEVVFLANDRSDQEDLIAQLNGGVKAPSMPVSDLVSDGTYMVIRRIAQSLYQGSDKLQCLACQMIGSTTDGGVIRHVGEDASRREGGVPRRGEPLR